ncbi:MAG: hypothetical protein J6R85_03070 [Lentisphaeria bacterium]|nr:hypothetical protein [Lentisphaeria bacterium]
MAKKKENIEKNQSDVEAALLRRALGFEQKEIHSEDICDRKSGEVLENIRRRMVVKEIPPDVRALLFWLKNRCPGRWSESGTESVPDYRFGEEEESL